MGQEITERHFRREDFNRFGRRLREETELLAEWLEEGRFSRDHGVGGFELEAWLVDEENRPAPINEQFLERVDNPLVSPELSRFNIELNSTPRPLAGDSLERMEAELAANWADCRRVAAELGADLVMIGTLPTVTDEMLTLENMSAMARYRALNEQVLRLRQGRPIRLDIQGWEHLHAEHHDVMLEAATTSFQIHLQVSQERAARYYNALQVIAAPMVAASGNAPFLFGRRLWRETRIPLFEQAVAVGGVAGAAFGPLKRVTFGSGYVRHSLLELFQENEAHYPVLLPVALEAPPERLPHLRLHNGTIWRWNRPLVDFDRDGTPHLRIEHRVVPAGPSVVDTIANAALFFGLASDLAERPEPVEQRLPFATARENLYSAAKHGLQANITWLDGAHGPVRELLQEELLPAARRGLAGLEVEGRVADHYLKIIEGRVASGRTGAEWQIACRERRGVDFAGLVAAYRACQESGLPVHRWPL